MSRVTTWPIVGLLAVAVLFTLVGCKPYQKPEYVEVESNETAFVKELEGEGSQGTYDSEAQLKAEQVATKRIRITKRWDQKGRLPWHGKWIPTIRVITVDRTPVTREWRAEEMPNGRYAEGKGIWVESKDSVGFSTGFSCTARIDEADAATFLYYYRGRTLAQVMDTEIRARFQKIASEVSALYDMDELRNRKLEIIQGIENDVEPFFAERGISVTTTAMFGGFAYEDPEIQEAINEIFVVQQLKKAEQAKLEAQDSINARLKLEGQGEADKLREVAMGQRDAEITRAEGEAQRIRAVAEATAEANQDPLFLQLRALSVQEEQIRQWNGQFPSYFMSMGQGDDSPGMLLNVPVPSN